jgi:hypothetical protein
MSEAHSEMVCSIIPSAATTNAKMIGFIKVPSADTTIERAEPAEKHFGSAR